MGRDTKTINQLTIARRIASEMSGITLSDIQHIIQREQELTIDAVRNGFKVVKKNYLTIYPVEVRQRMVYSPLTGEQYDIPKHNSVAIRVGESFKATIASKQIPTKTCHILNGVTN